MQEFNDASEPIQEFNQEPLHQFEKEEEDNSELSFEELNVDNAEKTETEYSPATNAFKKYDQK